MDNSNNQPYIKLLSEKDTGPAAIKKRSVVIASHRTSISLENIFWNLLRDIAKQQGKSVNQLVSEVDRGRSGNLSSALRTYVLLMQMGEKWAS